MNNYLQWKLAKARRDTAAYQLATAHIYGNTELRDKEAVKFQAAEDEMRRLEAERNEAEQ